LRNENLLYRSTIEKTMHKSLLEKDSIKKETTDLFNKAKDKYSLTEREIDVLKYITEGLNNNEISEKLFVSHNTIKYHTRNIYEKMEITNRAQAVSRIYEKI
jgi:DNA-binding NarL/FixJ family response regulator